MVDKLINYFANKKILILGFGKEGISTYNFIRRHFKTQKIYIADERKDFEKESDILMNDKNAICISGEGYLNDLDKYDVIMKSPGISLAHIETKSFYSKIKSETELLLEFSDVYTIGITGSKGKSTTSSLIYETIKSQGKECMLLGNIGTPVFDYIDKLKKDMILVLEMSSHQLEYMETSPNIAILLNIYEEHLDHYLSYEKYADAKCNIFKYQKESDFFLYNEDNEMIKNEIKKYKSKAREYKISIESESYEENKTFLKDKFVYLNDEKLYNIEDERNLIGKCNLENIMFALTVGKILHLNLNKTIETINNFEPLPHRIEKIGKFNGITYYNDAIATIPEATINSIESLENVNTLIIGGMDRGVNFDKFIDYLNSSEIVNLICMPDTGYYIGKKITNDKMKIYMVEDLKEAVNIAKSVTKKDTICLLSPAAASYGFFKNFKEKGEMYKKLVRENA